MPYYNFEGIVIKNQLQVWHSIATVRTAMQQLDELSFHNMRDSIRKVLNSISTNNTRYSPFYDIATPSKRFGENLVCYNMTSDSYIEIFNSLYKALAVNAKPTPETSRDIPVCDDSYYSALEAYSSNLLQLKKNIYAGVGAYNRDTFEEFLGITWKY